VFVGAILWAVAFLFEWTTYTVTTVYADVTVFVFTVTLSDSCNVALTNRGKAVATLATSIRRTYKVT
jgi:hypothetical protein